MKCAYQSAHFDQAELGFDMCFTIPKKIKKIVKGIALTETGLRIRLGDIKAAPGEYLLVYGNMAVEKVSKQRAELFRNALKRASKNKEND